MGHFSCNVCVEGYRGLPPRTGTIPDIASFDHEFFKLNRKQADKMEPLIRLLLETTQEALMDAKLSIPDLRGSRTGVYAGNMYTDFCRRAAREPHLTGYEAVNGAQNMLANRISFQYDFQGPSVVMDTACSSSFVALNQARQDILSGAVDRAIVCGSSITSDPNINATLKAYTMLSPTGTCYSFDDRANGYCRSEGIFVVVLESKRVCSSGYARVLATSVNSDGFTSKGITFPSGEAQTKNMRAALERNNVSVDSICYIEAHGTGTKAGDNQELQGMTSLFYGDATDPSKYRNIPIGSVKSCMGHAEGASGLASLVKCLLMMEHKQFLPNQHFESTSHEALLDGRFRVVTEAESWSPGNVCISNYGFGGTNAFAVIGPGNITYENPVSECEEKGEVLTKLSFSNGGHAEANDNWLQDQVLLGNDSSYRFRNGKKVTPTAKVAFVFGGQGSQWPCMGQQLYTGSASFRATIDRLGQHLRELDSSFDLADLFLRGTEWMKKDLTVVGITAYQIAAVNLLRDSLGIEADFCIGHSLGETAAAYCHGVQTEQETICIAYIRGLLSKKLESGGTLLLRTESAKPHLSLVGRRNEFYFYALPDDEATRAQYHAQLEATDTIFDLRGQMAAVGLEVETIQTAIDELELTQTVVACRNSPKGQTVSGATTEIQLLKRHLMEQHPGLFWRDVNTDGVAYHAPHLQAHFDDLVSSFECILGSKERKIDPQRWISTSAQENNGESPQLDAFYHARNITGPVFFSEAISKLPSNTLVVEVGSSQSLLGQVKRTRKDLTLLGLVKVRDPSSEIFYLDTTRAREAFWSSGYIHAFYPKNSDVSSQVLERDCVNRSSRLSLHNRYPDLWNHSVQHRVYDWKDFESDVGGSDENAYLTMGSSVSYDLLTEDQFLLDHKIAGRQLFPATGHVWTMWKAIGVDKGLELDNFEILQAVVLDPEESPAITFDVQLCGDIAGVYFGEMLVARSKFRSIEPAELTAGGFSTKQLSTLQPSSILESAEMYNQFRRFGYEYGEKFQLLEQRSLAGQLSVPAVEAVAVLKPACHFIPFLDNILQVSFIEYVDALMLPTRIKQLKLMPTIRAECMQSVDALIDRDAQLVRTPGCLMQGLELSRAAPRPSHDLVHEAQVFFELGWTHVENLEQEQVLSAATRLAAKRTLAYLEAHECMMETKPWLLNLKSTAEKHLLQSFSAPNKSVEDLRQWISYRLVDDVTAPEAIGAFLDNPLFALSTHPEHEEFYTSNELSSCSQGTLARIAGLLRNEVGGHGNMRIFEVGAGACGFAQRIYPLLHNALGSYICSDVRPVTLPDAVKSDDRFSCTLHNIDNPLPATQKVCDVIVASHALFLAADVRTTLRHLSQNLRVGGLFVVEEFVGDQGVLMWGADRDFIWNRKSDVRHNGLWMNVEEWRQCIDDVAELELVFAEQRPGNLTLVLCRTTNTSSNPTKRTAKLRVQTDIVAKQSDDPVRTPQRFSGAVSKTTKLSQNWSSHPSVIHDWQSVDLTSKQIFDAAGSHGFRRSLEQEDDVSNLQALCSDNSAPLSWDSGISNLRYITIEDGCIGTTVSVPFTHTIAEELSSSQGEFSLMTGKPGDLSTVKWKKEAFGFERTENTVRVHFATLNESDVEICFAKRRQSDFKFGLEFSGVSTDGPVFGIANGTLQSSVCTPLLSWKVPAGLSLQDAATLPKAYLEAAFALFSQAKLRDGQSVLIFSADSCVGQAATFIAQRHGLVVHGVHTLAAYANAKLDDQAPFFVDENNEAAAEEMRNVMLRRTSGQGVDCVLHCSTAPGNVVPLLLECLNCSGHFCDMAGALKNKTQSPSVSAQIVQHLSRGVEFHSFDIVSALNRSEQDRRDLQNLMETLLNQEDVTPLLSVVHQPRDILTALKRYESGDFHGQKVLVNLHDYPPSELVSKFEARGVHVVTGGLGGFGFELARWLLQNGAEQIVVTSRSGLRTSWQHFRYSSLVHMFGANSIVISNLDVTKMEQAEELLRDTNVDSRLRGIWHSAVVLRDGLFSKTESRNWDACVTSKVGALQNLHEASLPFQLDNFVVFSSVTSMGGNCGQTAYGFGNNACERLVELRLAQDLPGIAVQWGAIESAGLATNLAGEIIPMGRGLDIAKQNIDDSLESLHKILLGGSTSAVVSSYRVYVEEKKPIDSASAEDKVQEVGSVLTKLAEILGGTASDYDASQPLQEYGLDSLSVVEVMNWMNRLVQVKVTPSFITRDTSSDSIYAYIDQHRISD